VIPESQLIQILLGLKSEFELPFFSTQEAEMVARHIIVHQFKVMEETKLPAPALLNAAFLVIERILRKHGPISMGRLGDSEFSVHDFEIEVVDDLLSVAFLRYVSARS